MQSTGLKGISGQTFYEFDLVVYNPPHWDTALVIEPAVGLILWNPRVAGFGVYQLDKNNEYRFKYDDETLAEYRELDSELIPAESEFSRYNFVFYDWEGAEFSWETDLELIGCVYQEKDFVGKYINQIIKTIIGWIAAELGDARAIAIDGDLHNIIFLLVGEECRHKGSIEEFESIATHGSWILRTITRENWYFHCEYVSFFDWKINKQIFSTDLFYHNMTFPEIPKEKVIV
jgi:hypothetical protein